MKKLALLLCLALAAGLFVSCGKGEESPKQNSAAPSQNGSQDAGFAENSADPGDAVPEDSPRAAGMDLDAILSGARISGKPGAYSFSYDHPQVPDGLHLSVSLKVYREEEDGDRLMFSYDSDGAWLSRPQDYDPSERRVSVPVDVRGQLSEMYVLVSAKAADLYGDVCSAAAVRDSEGCMTFGFEDVFAWSGAQ